MKKICFFIANMGCSGGTERVTSLVANALSIKGCKVMILSLQQDVKTFFPLEQGVVNDKLFDSLKKGRYRYFSALIKLRKYLKKNEVDILINVESMLVLYSIPASFGLSIKNICWEHFSYNFDLGRKSRRWARHLAAKYVDLVITLTNEEKNIWIKNEKVKTHIKSIPNPIILNPFKQQLNLEKKCFLAVGRLEEEKGFDLLLRAWKLSKDNGLLDWKLRIIGSGKQSDLLLDLCRELNLVKSVEFIPVTKNIESFYKESSFFLVSSRFECFPMVMLEAQSFGIPIIAFNCSNGVSDIIEHDINGWLVENGNIKELSNQINYASKLSNQDYEKLVDNSLQKVKRYSIDYIIEEWEEIL